MSEVRLKPMITYIIYSSLNLWIYFKNTLHAFIVKFLFHTAHKSIHTSIHLSSDLKPIMPIIVTQLESRLDLVINQPNTSALALHKSSIYHSQTLTAWPIFNLMKLFMTHFFTPLAVLLLLWVSIGEEAAREHAGRSTWLIEGTNSTGQTED